MTILWKEGLNENGFMKMWPDEFKLAIVIDAHSLVMNMIYVFISSLTDSLGFPCLYNTCAITYIIFSFFNKNVKYFLEKRFISFIEMNRRLIDANRIIKSIL